LGSSTTRSYGFALFVLWCRKARLAASY
jgi:hypothetical protein